MGNENFCMDVSNREWVAKYDYDRDGYIDQKDLNRWASEFKGIKDCPASYAKKHGGSIYCEIPHNWPQIYCDLFKMEMEIQKIIHTFAMPEAARTSPIAGDTYLDILRHSRRSFNYARQQLENILEPLADYCKSGESLLDLKDDPKTFCEAAFSFGSAYYIEKKAELEIIFDEIMWSQKFDEGKLYGVGVDFYKEKGEPAIIKLVDNLSDAGYLGVEAYDHILAINGEDISNLTHEETRILLRGPKDSDVELTIKKRNGDINVIMVNRAWVMRAMR